MQVLTHNWRLDNFNKFIPKFTCKNYIIYYEKLIKYLKVPTIILIDFRCMLHCFILVENFQSILHYRKMLYKYKNGDFSSCKHQICCGGECITVLQLDYLARNTFFQKIYRLLYQIMECKYYQLVIIIIRIIFRK